MKDILFPPGKPLTYREPLCTADNKGTVMFSPLCNPDFQKEYQKIEITQQRRQGWGDVPCHVTPVQKPQAQVKQYTDAQSAYDWYKDPTYSQRVAIRKVGLDDVALDKNPSLLLYHQLKSMEKMGGSLLNTL